MSLDNKNNTLCLSMIVYNNSDLLIPLLNSLIPLLDTYCIFDTGSTDNTPRIIKDFFDKNDIHGHILYEPYQNFSYNLNFSLNYCFNNITSDYILILDPDSSISFNTNFNINNFKSSLINEIYIINNSFNHNKNIHIIKNNINLKYHGILKENSHISFSKDYKKSIIDKDIIIINPNMNTEKYNNRILLLTNKLHSPNPKDSIYDIFNLANLYFKTNNYKKSLVLYLEIIKLNKLNDEYISHCYYNIGNIYNIFNKTDKSIGFWIESYNKNNLFINPLYSIIHHFRIHKNRTFFYTFYKIAKNHIEKIKNNTEYRYFYTNNDIYKYKLEYEFFIMFYYLDDFYKSKKNLEFHRFYMKLLSRKIDNQCHYNTMINLKFYMNKLSNYCVYKNTSNNKLIIDHLNCDIYSLMNTLNNIGNLTHSTWENKDEYYKSTPSFTYISPSSFLVCVRYVHYYINEHGHYIIKDNICRTRNVFAIVDTGILIREFELKYNINDDSNEYQGLEDIRLWSDIYSEDKSIYYSCVRPLGNPQPIVIQIGKIDLISESTINYRNLNINTNQLQYNNCEKNWVIVNCLHHNFTMIYKWYPFTIGSVSENDNILNITHAVQSNLPEFFKHIRGSSNSIIFKDEIWFLSHAVIFSDNLRHYYHIIIAIDKNTYKIKKYTPFFIFNNSRIEYSLAFTVVSNFILFGYSSMDRNTNWSIIPLNIITSMFIDI